MKSVLERCSLSQLKHLAELVGLNTTATKPALTEALCISLSRSAHKSSSAPLNNETEPTRILSIDMGIRNLAFAVLEVRPNVIENNVLLRSSECMPPPWTVENKLVTAQMPRILDSIKLLEWRRTSIYQLGLHTPASTPDRISSTTPDEDSINADGTNPAHAAIQESYDPLSLAAMTYNLVARVFLPYKVSHVLIERQRYRSAGAAAILEWTVRVNMLESMLHAVFHTLRQTHLVSSSSTELEHKTYPKNSTDDSTHGVPIPVVESVSPKRVGQFWSRVMQCSEDATAPDPGREHGRNKSKIEKEAKIDMACSFMRSGDSKPGLQCSETVEATRDAFLWTRARQVHRKLGSKAVEDAASANSCAANLALESDADTKRGKPPNMAKLDDLADCLLQGTAWAQWEANRLYLREWIAGVEVAEPDASQVRPARTAKERKTVTKAARKEASPKRRAQNQDLD